MWTIARLMAATDESFPARGPTRTKPSGDGVFERVANPWMAIVPFAEADENAVFNLRILQWTEVDRGGVTWYLPIVIPSAPYFVCTVGTQTGIAGASVTDADKFVDTITCADAAITSQTLSCRIVSSADNTCARIEQDTLGLAIVEFLFAKVSGTIVGMNAMFLE